MHSTRAALVLLGLGFLSRQGHAQEMDVPPSVQIPLLYKILPFDRKLGSRAAGDDIVIAILYQSSFRASAAVQADVLGSLRKQGDSTIAGHPVRWVSVDLSSIGNLAAILTAERVDVVYVAPLRGIDLMNILTVARAKSITTFTGVPEFVERGLAVGVDLQRERPRILINLSASRAEGAEFTSQLLRVATVVEGR